MADDHHIVGLFEQGLQHVQERGALRAAERAARPRGPETKRS
jgi:hypothetical protein